jgi:hypothetical protein
VNTHLHRLTDRSRTVVAIAVVGILASSSVLAAGLELLNAGLRVRVGDNTVIGKKQPETFHEYDVFANFGMPWRRQCNSPWGWSLRLLASAGVMQAANRTALVASAVPVLVFGSADGRFSADAGIGLSLLSRHRYALQDYGGPVQAALTVAVSLPLYRRVGVGYRFMHYSDASAYGSHTIGADFHMAEFRYRF